MWFPPLAALGLASARCEVALAWVVTSCHKRLQKYLPFRFILFQAMPSRDAFKLFIWGLLFKLRTVTNQIARVRGVRSVPLRQAMFLKNTLLLSF